MKLLIKNLLMLSLWTLFPYYSTQVQANYPTTNFYLDASIGTAKLEGVKASPGTRVLDQSANTSASRIAVGWLFLNQRIGIEGGYTKFAGVTAPFSYPYYQFTGQTKSKRDAIDILGVMKYPFNEAKTILGYAALGTAYVQANTTVMPNTLFLPVKKDGWVPIIALGLEYDFTRHFGISGTYHLWGRHGEWGSSTETRDETAAFMFHLIFRNTL